MNFLFLIFIIYLLPLILGLVLMVIFEFLCKKLNRKNDSAKDVSPLIFIPLLNWIIVIILPIGVIIFGSEYFGNLFIKLLNKI